MHHQRSSKGQSKELPMQQQHPYPTTLEEGHLQQSPIQLFWGLQTPHSESFFPATDASDKISNASPEQESPEDYCPLVPNPSPKPWASQTHAAISTPPAQFPLSDEIRKKPERHLQKRLIQHWWGLPRRIHESLTWMSGPSTLPQVPESLCHCGRSGISNKSEIKLSMAKSVYVEDPEMLQLEDSDLVRYKGDLEKDNNDLEKDKNLEKDNDDLKKDGGHNPENGPEDYLLSDPVSSSDNEMGSDSEKELRSPSVKNSMVSEETMGQRQLENALKIHLHRKSEEISEGHLPGTVCNSWNTRKPTSLLSEKSQTEIKQRSLPPSGLLRTTP
ncbi:spermatogenesis-associated protein 31D4-like [Mustela erminea]|uniref:spermatogenesis-associated protein 31D4-like n=1 Tax=Mustela erminea TaxID=36723 RepID=UPI0013866570|nr:spermatogenesis-associated protein 31D4-like [Mustela erminea]